MTLRTVWVGLMAFVLAACSASGPKNTYKSAEAAPMAPMMGRVGIMSLLGNDLKHIHTGTTPWSGSEKSYNVQFDFNGFVVEELRKGLLAKTPYQPVILQSTGQLRQASTKWMDTWNGNSFDPNYQREFDGIMASNQLAMLIVIAYPEIGDGVIGSSQKLSGSGLYTRSFLGSTKSAVFSTLQFYRIVGRPGKLVFPIAAPSDRSIGDVNAPLPDDLADLPARYLVPVYDPLRNIVRNKIQGFLNLPRKIGA